MESNAAREKWEPFYRAYWEDCARGDGNFINSACIATDLCRDYITHLCSKDAVQAVLKRRGLEVEDIISNSILYFAKTVIPAYTPEVNDNFFAYASIRLTDIAYLNEEGKLEGTEKRRSPEWVEWLSESNNEDDGSGKEKYEGNIYQEADALNPETKRSAEYSGISTEEAVFELSERKKLDKFEDILHYFSQKYGRTLSGLFYTPFYLTKARVFGWSLEETYEKVFKYFESLGAKPIDENDIWDKEVVKKRTGYCVKEISKNLGLDIDLVERYIALFQEKANWYNRFNVALEFFTDIDANECKVA